MKLTRLYKPAILNHYVQPISLPVHCVNHDSTCLISTGPRDIDSETIDSETCRNAYNDMITHSMTCFRNQHSCEILQGAPVDCDGELQGIFSWDFRSQCGFNNEGLGVFAKICVFNDWIQDTMAMS